LRERSAYGRQLASRVRRLPRVLQWHTLSESITGSGMRGENRFSVFLLFWWTTCICPPIAFGNFSSSTSCGEALSYVGNAGQGPIRSHPEEVPYDDLTKVGNVFWVDPDAFKASPMIRAKLSGPTKFTVISSTVDANNLNPKRHVWKGSKRVAYLASEETGIVPARTEDLFKHAYRRRGYFILSPFSRGEYVQIRGGIHPKHFMFCLMGNWFFLRGRYPGSGLLNFNRCGI
jgi:hypothetical protein